MARDQIDREQARRIREEEKAFEQATWEANERKRREEESKKK